MKAPHRSYRRGVRLRGWCIRVLVVQVLVVILDSPQGKGTVLATEAAETHLAARQCRTQAFSTSHAGAGYRSKLRPWVSSEYGSLGRVARKGMFQRRKARF